MGRAPCCDKKGLKKGPWTPAEDQKLVDYINNHGHGSWRSLPKLAGLLRCGKSCRLRWTNYLRPDIKRGPFTPEEQKLVIELHSILGNRWAAIASQLPGRTDSEIKNLWNTHLRKRLIQTGIDPLTHEPVSSSDGPTNQRPSSRRMTQWESRLSSSSSSSSPDGDYFLRLWNSEVGETFRNFDKKENVTIKKPPDQNDDHECKSSVEDIRPGSDSRTSDDVEEYSSESALELLLDFPSSDEISLLGQNDCYYSLYHANIY